MDVEVTDAIQRLTSNPGVAVSRLTSDAASARRLQRKFLRHVGIGPKRLARMLRLQRATRLWASGQASSWAGLALAAGYSDQAHMVRDCREFAGTSPGRIAKFEGLMSYSFKTSHR
jgi:transcriptional regulator GlxA family with amidase domain